MQWFIINGEHKVGPFTKDKLKDLVSRENLPLDTLIQSESMSYPMKFSLIFPAKKKSETGVPDLPDLPLPGFPQAPASAPKLSTQKVGTPKKGGEKTLKESFDQGIESIKVKTSIPYKLYLSIAAAFIVLVSIFYYVKSFTPTFSRPKEMSLETFQKVRDIHDAENLKARVFFSKDKKTIWFATNNFVSGQILITLSSIKDRVVSKKRISMISKAYLSDGLASFKEFIFDSGDKLVDGEYMMSIESKQPLEAPLIYTLHKTQASINFRQKVIVSSLKKEVFEKALKNFLEKTKENTNEFESELIQKYLTLKTMVEQIKESFLESFSNTDLSWSQRANEFESNYKKQFGPFFTSFVIANENQYSEINKKEFPNKIEIISDYTRLSRIAKGVGLTSVEVMEQFEQFKFESSSVEKVLEFKAKSVALFDRVIEECSEKIKKLSSN